MPYTSGNIGAAGALALWHYVRATMRPIEVIYYLYLRMFYHIHMTYTTYTYVYATYLHIFYL